MRRRIMMLFFRKKLSYIFPFYAANRTIITSCFFSSSSSTTHHLLSSLLRFSTSATNEDPSPRPPFIVEYLINSHGFSSDEAIKASRYLGHIESPSQPDSVVDFLKQIGLTDTQIKNLVSKYPRLLCAGVEKSLKPKITVLQELGFSESELVQLVAENPAALRFCDLRHKVEFWRDFFGTNEDLLKAMRRGNLLTCSVSKKIMPNISLLRDCGISNGQIAKMILHSPLSVTRSYDTVKALVRRTDELGVSRASVMFGYVFLAISNISKTTLDAKIDLLKSFDWSEGEVLSAIRKAPKLLGHSEQKIRATMNFLVKEAGCEPSYIAIHPSLLSYSLNGRMIPRYSVIQILKSEGLLKRELGLKQVMAMVEEVFLKKFVLSHVEKLPKLREAYVAACVGTDPN